MKAIIVEDSDFVRAIWRDLFTKIPGISLIGEFAHVSSAITGIRRLLPDLILLDLQLYEGNGMDVMRVVREECPETKVLVVTNFTDEVCKRYYIKAGAHAVFDKSREIKRLFNELENLAHSGAARPQYCCA